MVDLHVESEQSYFSLVLDETIDILELLVLVVWTTDGAHLERVSWFGLSNNILTTEVLVMDILFIFTALMVSSENVLFGMYCTVLH